MVLHWFRDHVKNNTPLDRMIRDLVTGQPIPTEYGPVTYYTGTNMPAEWAERTSRAFLGVRLDCIQCHAHSRARWTPEDRHHLVAFFAQTTVKKVAVPGNVFDMLQLDRSREFWHPTTQKAVPPRFLDGAFPNLDDKDRIDAFAEWLTSAKNPYFARMMVNRIWQHLHGKGIGHPPETLHELPLTANDDLLDALAKSFVAERFDVKQMIRIIMNSRTYQLSSTPNVRNKEDIKYFSRAIPQHMPPAVLFDAVSQLLEVPDKIDGAPPGTRAIHVLDAIIPFARPRSRFSECELEADETDDNLAVVLQSINGDELQRRLKKDTNRAHRLLREKKTNMEILEVVFLASHSRLPRADEREMFANHLAKTKDRNQLMEDLLWAVINSREFLQRR